MKCKGCEKLRESIIRILMVNYMETKFGLGEIAFLYTAFLNSVVDQHQLYFGGSNLGRKNDGFSQKLRFTLCLLII